MEGDDVQVGRILNRREVLGLLGAGGAVVLGISPLDASTHPRFRLPSCIVKPSQTEGPYFVDTKLNRSDIRSDPTDGSLCDGVPLHLMVQVSTLNSQGCVPLSGALVDLWQCDAMGVYSGVEDINGQFNTLGKQFLRGHQLTDSEGLARFLTIYPGWYQGRTVHLHFKIRTDPSSDVGQEFTSQLYFDDVVTDQVFTHHAYTKEGDRRRNSDDRIFRSGGDQLLLNVMEEVDGYAATFDIGLQID